MIKVGGAITVHSIILTHLILMFTLTLLMQSHLFWNDENGLHTSFAQPLHEYPPFWIQHNLMTFLHHNDITSAKVNTAAPWIHQGPLEPNLEPDDKPGCKISHLFWIALSIIQLCWYKWLIARYFGSRPVRALTLSSHVTSTLPNAAIAMFSPQMWQQRPSLMAFTFATRSSLCA